MYYLDCLDMAHFFTVFFDDEERICRPPRVPNVLFNPLLPDVSNLKILVAPHYDDHHARPEEAVSLQASMELNNNTLLFAKIAVSTYQLFFTHGSLPTAMSSLDHVR